MEGLKGTTPNKLLSLTFTVGTFTPSAGKPFSNILKLSLLISSDIFPKLIYKSPTWFDGSFGFVRKPSSAVIE